MTDASLNSEQSLPFVELATVGKNNWWRYVVAVPLIFVVGLIGLIATLACFEVLGYGDVVANLSELGPESLAGNLTEAALTFALALSAIAWYLPGILFIVPLVHSRAWRTLLHAGRRFNWAGFLVSLLMIVLVAPIELIQEFMGDDPDVLIVFEAERFIVFAFVAVILLPLQILAEEVFFRGYLMQGVAAITRQVWLRLLLPASLFAGAHYLNTEVVVGGTWAMTLYLVIGLYLGILVLRGNGLEYAAGFHLGNNLVAALVVSSPDSSFGTPTIFRVGQVDWGIEMVGGTLILFAIHYFVVFKLLGRFHLRSAS